MSRKKDILRTGRTDNSGSDRSSEDDEGDMGWGKERVLPSGFSSLHDSRSSSPTGDSVEFTDAAKRRASDTKTGDPHLARVLLLNESTRRHDRKTMSLVEKTLERYVLHRKFTYFSDRTDLLQGDTLFTIGGEGLEILKGEPFFWIDVNGFSEADLSQLATVHRVPFDICTKPLYCRTSISTR